MISKSILNEFNKTPELIDEAAEVFYNQEIYSDKEATAKELTKSILLNKIEQEMADPETCANYEKMSALCAEMEELKNRQNDLMDEWAELSEELS